MKVGFNSTTGEIFEVTTDELTYLTCELCHEACAECLDNEASKTNPGGVAGYGECCGKECGPGFYR